MSRRRKERGRPMSRKYPPRVDATADSGNADLKPLELHARGEVDRGGKEAACERPRRLRRNSRD